MNNVASIGYAQIISFQLFRWVYLIVISIHFCETLVKKPFLTPFGLIRINYKSTIYMYQETYVKVWTEEAIWFLRRRFLKHTTLFLNLRVLGCRDEVEIVKHKQTDAGPKVIRKTHIRWAKMQCDTCLILGCFKFFQMHACS